MASVGKLYTYPNNHRALRAVAVAAANGLKVEVDPSFQMGVTNKTPEYLAKFPAGQVPAFEGTDGFTVSQTSAIAYYLASLSDNAALLGRSTKEAAAIQQWVAYADTDLSPPVSQPAYMNFGYVQFNKNAADAAFQRAESTLKTLETVLQTSTFLVADRLSLADITVASVLLFAFQQTLDKAFRAKFPNVVRYFETVVNQPSVKEAFGAVQYLDTFVLQTPKKDAKPKAEKAEKPKAEKKEEKPKAAPKEEEEEAVPALPKEKNPLDSLPKSSFILDEWKRQYSNLDTRGEDPSKHSLAWFYQNFDSEGYWIARVDFKYNEELTMTFMSNNQIGGFFNRLEASRKYLFGSVGVLGKSNDSIITGVFVGRGKEIEPVVSVAPDWESYTYTPLDLSKPEDKAFFEGAMAWDLVVDGKEWVDGKNFK